ncbi:hypothetical protein STAFG_6813 [Streptomyces afghaniensis 772]|uniref:Uncharacterized protein n=1 Tax=Streptomyces afghaniensis 772 TaxID=1283301 RepID=S4M9N7_9ACTN|nr:hypothetical protein STAFG_6813 [Streptomyces afghaniensis 772]
MGFEFGSPPQLNWCDRPLLIQAHFGSQMKSTCTLA